MLEEPVISMPKVTSHKVSEQTNEVPTITHEKQEPHEEEKIDLLLSLAGIFMIWYMFR